MRKAKSKNSPGRANSRAALSVQQTIPYLAMHPDGVCKLPGGLYTWTIVKKVDKGTEKIKSNSRNGQVIKGY